MFRVHRDVMNDAQHRFELRDAANQPVALSAHLARDLALDHIPGAAVEYAPPRIWRLGFRWPVYLRATAQ